MNFNTLEFAVFLTIVLLLFAAIRTLSRSSRLENLMLVTASCIFYGWWDRRFLFLFMLSTWLDYFCGLAMLNRRPAAAKCTVLFVVFVAGAFLLCAPIDWDLVGTACRGWLHGELVVPSFHMAPEGSWRETTAALIGTGILSILFFVGYRWFSGHAQRRYFLLLSVVTQLALLGFFKYYDFFISSIEQGLIALGCDPPGWELGIIVPIGISFYTFHTMSYTIDVYRGELMPTESLIDFALFVSFFPQMIAGPIARARELLPQFQQPRTLSWSSIQCGTWLLGWGLFKKMFIADNLARIVAPVYTAGSSVSGPQVLMATYAFAFQIYCDFSGYSDIARGISRLVGIELMLNFDLPYTATNPREFWRRWHISLSTWLRDYLYRPLGGNRGTTILIYRNLMLTMILGGIWHGARMNFLWWGIYQGALLCLHRIAEPGLLKITPASDRGKAVFRFVSWLVFFHLVCYGWLLFRCQSNAQIVELTKALGSNWGEASLVLNTAARIIFYIMPLLIVEFFQWRSENLLVPLCWPTPVRWALYVACFYLTLSCGAFDVTEFIYFQF
jgi:D-alanyl-lipoteichoic acid acyltransferase DltB (MBOAT superfamily)